MTASNTVTPGASPPPVLTLVRPAVRVTQSIDLVTGSSTSVEVTCAALACHAKILLTITSIVRTKVHNKIVSKKKITVLGSGSKVIGAGKSGSIRVVLTAAGRAALSQAKQHELRVTEAVTVAGGKLFLRTVWLRERIT